MEKVFLIEKSRRNIIRNKRIRKKKRRGRSSI